MVRTANSSDISGLLKLCFEFFYSSYLEKYTYFDEDSMRETLENVLANDDSTLFIMEKDNTIVGMLAIVTGRAFYNKNCKIAQELFWYVQPTYRGTKESLQLIKEAETWASYHDVNILVLAHLLDEKEDKLDRFYTRRGMDKQETFYYKGMK